MALRSAWKEQDEDRASLATAYRDLDDKQTRTEKALAEAKAFIDLTDAGDLNRVSQGLTDINEAIDEIAFGFVEQLPDAVSAMPIPNDLETLATERAAQGQLGALRFLSSFKTSAFDDQPTKLGDVLHSILKVILCEELNAHLLRPFHLFARALLGGGVDLLHEMHQQMRSTGNRVQAAQWRAMSFSAVHSLVTPEEREELLRQLTSHLLSTLVRVWYQSDAPLLDESTFLQPTAQQILRLVTEGLDWLKLHRQHYLSTEFDIIFPTSSPSHASVDTLLLFDETTMEQVGGEEMNAELGGGGGRQVIATLAFGLEQVKLRKGSGGEERTERLPLLKAEVWTASERKKGRTEVVEDRRSTP
ncbi:hypothetical protein BCR35DRAFT_333778 [Leucosporidium creatinivorum]|uniref:Uncharacterized protein n=1 Tax=Leucosporidium creatinivorum TaxID=106004 RepID=A0A1Y2END1_9BASI|nr:hypothetical protein BCR35DRAFT_333778 [Leucosporidium creatinivorum]